MYYIHDYVKDTWRSTETWWDLVKYFYRDKSDYWWINDIPDSPFENIAHNINDKKISYSPNIYKTVYIKRSEIIYNDDMVVVNIADIKKALKIYKPRKKKYRGYKERYFDNHPFTFRFDPVPHVGTGRGGGSSWRAPKKNKNYIAKLQEFAKNSSRVRNLKYFAGLYWDDFPYKNNTRSWKKKKKRKQWM